MNRLLKRKMKISALCVIIIAFIMSILNPITSYASDMEVAEDTALSAQEIEWASTKERIVVGYLDDYLPYSDNENGETIGVVSDVTAEILSRLGLTQKLAVEYVSYSSSSEMVEAAKAGTVDLIFPFGGGDDYAAENGLILSMPIIDAASNLIIKGEYSEEKLSKFGVNKNNMMQYYYVVTYFPDAEIVLYDSIEECLEAVKNGEVYSTTLNGMRGSVILKNSKYIELSAHMMPETDPRTFGVSVSEPILLDVLNKGIAAIGPNYGINVSYNYTDRLYTYTTFDFLRENRIPFSLAAFAVVTFILVFFINNAVSMKKKVREKEKHRAELQEQLDIVDSLAQSYDGVYYIDIAGEKYETICNTGLLSIQNVDKSGSTRVLYEYLCSKVVRFDYRRDASKFFALNTISERLASKKIISMQFKSTYDSWFEASFVPVARGKDDDYNFVIATIRLIQDQKEEEQKQNMALHEALEIARDANKAKNRFLLNMSHDIRTPLSAIIGFSELLENNMGDEEKAGKYLNKIKTSNDYLLSLLDNVLEITRFENGSINLEEEPTDISKLLNDIAEEIGPEAKQKKIELLTNLNVDSLPLMIDARKLKEVIIKLISNSVTFTEEGGKIALDAEEVFAEDCSTARVKIAISDTGIGMSEEFLPHIFEEFSREREESIASGAGLGLNLVKKLVDIMGGKIEVESRKNVGTTFTMVFNFALASKTHSEEFNDENVIEILRGRNILVAEDNDMNAELTQTILEGIGVSSARASDGLECVEMIEKAPAGFYDLVLMDVQMPIMDGYQATARIRKMSDIAKKNIPIIALTANAYEQDKQNSFDAGMDGYLTKPINSKKLFMGMAKMLEH